MAQIQDVVCSTDRCLRALHHHHLLRASSKSCKPSDPSNPDLFKVCELQVAVAFAQQASKEMNAQEIDQLESFLPRPPPSIRNDDRICGEHEYSRELRAWAEGLLNVCPGNLIDRGVSLAAAVKETLLTEAKYLPGNAKKMPDLRKRLLNNGPFSCSHMSHINGFFR